LANEIDGPGQERSFPKLFDSLVGTAEQRGREG
jgi:hypothetical protein